MGYYPIFLDLADRPCVVIGGGDVGRRKVEGLLAAGARVTVISPTLDPELGRLRDEGAIRHVQREYRDGDLEGFELCMVATDDAAVNGAVAREGRARRVWVNASDDPVNCDFILPSVVRKGNITLAASTGGGSPALARRLREELEAYLDADMSSLADLLAETRRDLKVWGLNPDPEAWQRAIDARLRALLAQQRFDEARERLLANLGVDLPATAAKGEV